MPRRSEVETKSGPWTADEKWQLKEGIKKHGRDIDILVKLIPTRKRQQIKYYVSRYFQDDGEKSASTPAASSPRKRKEELETPVAKKPRGRPRKSDVSKAAPASSTKASVSSTRKTTAATKTPSRAAKKNVLASPPAKVTRATRNTTKKQVSPEVSEDEDDDVATPEADTATADDTEKDSSLFQQHRSEALWILAGAAGGVIFSKAAKFFLE